MSSRKMYRIFDTHTNDFVHAMIGAGTNATQTEFHSIKQARYFNCHGIFKDKVRYKIYEYEVVTRLVSEDVDPASQEDIDKHNKEIAEKKELENKYQFWL